MAQVFLKKFAASFAVLVAVILIGIKFYAWHVSDSVSLLSSLVDSTIDGFASLLNIIAIYHALKPADEYHRFGYGKIEALAALGQSLFIFASALFIFKEAVERFLNPEPIENSNIAITATLISILLTLVLLAVQRHVIKKTNSLAIEADHAHYKSDLLINIGVLAVIWGSNYFNTVWLDPIFGTLVALYIVFSIYHILKRSLEILMDKELPKEDRTKIASTLLGHPKVSGYHLLRTRSCGSVQFIQCHLEMNGKMTLSEAHQIAHEVEESIRQQYPKADIILHQDPEHLAEPHRDSL